MHQQIREDDGLDTNLLALISKTSPGFMTRASISGQKALHVCQEALSGDRKKKRIEPCMIGAEAETGRARRYHPRPDLEDIREILAMDLERKVW
jgi:hypothetical protein